MRDEMKEKLINFRKRNNICTLQFDNMLENYKYNNLYIKQHNDLILMYYRGRRNS